jgi:thiaminase/transcriptional activator TenA
MSAIAGTGASDTLITQRRQQNAIVTALHDASLGRNVECNVSRDNEFSLHGKFHQTRRFGLGQSPQTKASPWLHRAAILAIESQAGTNIMSERFTETLRAVSEPEWSHAVGHRFVKELFVGAVSDAVMARYLIQDHRFLDSFLMLLGAALASADTFEARLRFGRFIGMVSSEENTYFLRAFAALGVTETRRRADPDTQASAGFKAIMREAAETRLYAAALSVLAVAEWLYLDWASRAPQPLPDNFVHAEWIMLHDNPDFRGFVDFLRAELDRVGPGEADLCRDFFRRAVALELSFFEAAYTDRT